MGTGADLVKLLLKLEFQGEKKFPIFGTNLLPGRDMGKWAPNELSCRPQVGFDPRIKMQIDSRDSVENVPAYYLYSTRNCVYKEWIILLN